MKEQDRIQRLLSLLEKDKDNPETIYALACAYERDEKREEAQKWCQYIIEHFPDSLEKEMATEKIASLHTKGITQEKDIFLHPFFPASLSQKKKVRTCTIHPQRNADATCYRCERPFCSDCVLTEGNTIICQECLEKEKKRKEPPKPYSPPKGNFLTRLGIFTLLSLPVGAVWLLLWLIHTKRVSALAYLTTLLIECVIVGSSALFLYSIAPPYLPIVFPTSPFQIFWLYLLLSFLPLACLNLLTQLSLENFPERNYPLSAGIGFLTGGATAILFYLSLSPLLSPSIGILGTLRALAPLLAPLATFGALSGFLYTILYRLFLPMHAISWQVG